MQVVLVNFAHGNFYERQRWFNSKSAKLLGRFDKVYEYSLKDIDSDFHKKNDAIFQIKKGVGLWLWKPYFLNKVLNEINYGDYMFHCDSSSIFLRKIKPLIDQMQIDNKDIMVFALPLIEKQWTKPDLLNILQINSEDQNSNQVSGSYFILKKSDFTIQFISEWLNLCQEEKHLNESNDDGPNLPNYYQGHRYDQSILSLLVKKYKIIPFRDPSQYGEFPEMYRMHSSLNILNFNNSPYKTSILLLRKSKIISEFSRFCMKRIIKRMMPALYKKIIAK